MVVFPKTIDLTNARLNWLYRVSLVMTIVVLILKAWSLAEYSRTDLFEGEVSLISITNWDKAVQAWPQISNETLCASPWGHTMNKTGGNGSHGYSGMECTQPCPNGVKNYECVSYYEATWDEPNSVFFVTAWDEMDLWDVPDPTESNKPSVTILPFTSFYSIGIEHAYRVPAAAWIQPGLDVHSKEHDSSTSITTVVIDRNFKEFNRYLPGDSISFTISTLLGLVGASLDDINHRAKTTDPTYRLSGMGLHMDIFCSDLPQFGITPADDGLTCYLTVTLGMQAWSYKQESQLVDGETGDIRARNYRGIRISARARGAHRSPDMSTMFVNLATTLVLLQIPEHLCTSLQLCFLGTLLESYAVYSYRSGQLQMSARPLA